jgi:acetyl esterase/lipase
VPVRPLCRLAPVAALLLVAAVLAGLVTVVTEQRARGAGEGPGDDGRVVTSRSEPLRVRYAPGAGVSHTYLAWVPEGPAARRGVVLVHGGAWVRGSAELMAEYAHRLYDRGIPAFSVGYRLADRTLPGTRWGAQGRDVRAAVAHVRAAAARYGIARTRISAVGASAGGHLAAALGSGGTGRDTVAAVVAWSAPLDLARAWDDRATDRLGAYGLAERVRHDLVQCSPTSQDAGCRTRWRSATPGSAASAGDAPTLLFYQRDELVSPVHGEAYRDAYRAAAPDVEVRLDVRPGSRHAVDYVLDTQDGVPARVWRRTVAWVVSHT